MFIVRRKDVENQRLRVSCPLRRESAIYFLEEYSGKTTHGERKYSSYAADIYFPKSEPAMNLLPVTGLSPPLVAIGQIHIYVTRAPGGG